MKLLKVLRLKYGVEIFFKYSRRTGRQTIIQTVRQTDCHADRQRYRQTGKSADIL